jgi:ABC-2 type transport system permease protein
MKARLRYFGLIARANLQGLRDNPLQGAVAAAGMLVQNVLLFASWIVLFHAVGSIRGWRLPQIFLLYGLVFFSEGLALAVTEGIRHLTRKLASGEFDLYLLRPRHALPQLFLDHCNTANLGDIACGVLFLLIPAELTLSQMAFALGAGILLALLLVGVILLYQSLAFFFQGGGMLGDFLFNGIFYFSQTPQEGQGWLVRIVLFTVLPAGFTNILSIGMIEQRAPVLLALLAAATVTYLCLGWLVFNAGVRRYIREAD